MLNNATIARELPDQPEVVALLAEADAFYDKHYPPELQNLLDVSSLEAPNVHFFVARLDGAAAGFGAVVDHGDWGEVKRMYTAEAVRGMGFGRLILEALEEAGRALRLPVLRLETGYKQTAAIALYENAGYHRRGAFSHYPDIVESLFFEKLL